MMVQNHNSLPDKMGSPNYQYPTTVFPTNNKAPPLEGICSTKIGGMQTLKHEIRSSKFYELFINIVIKGETAMELKNFYNEIRMCFNDLNRTQEYLVTDNQSTKIHPQFQEYFVPYISQPYYDWNTHTYNSLVHSLLMALKIYTYLKFSFSPQSYKVVTTHTKISGYKFYPYFYMCKTLILEG